MTCQALKLGSIFGGGFIFAQKKWRMFLCVKFFVRLDLNRDKGSRKN